jgi:hypothetical protein
MHAQNTCTYHGTHARTHKHAYTRAHTPSSAQHDAGSPVTLLVHATLMIPDGTAAPMLREAHQQQRSSAAKAKRR